MKKSLTVMIGLIFISGLLFTQTTESTETKFNPAEETLVKQAEVIMDFVSVIGIPDKKISNTELSTLQDMVRNFFEIRKNFFKDVREISFLSSVKEEHHSKFLFVFECQEVLNAYFSGLTEEDDKDQTVKRFFEKHTGYQMDIEVKKLWGLRILLFIFLGLILGVLAMAGIASISDSGILVIAVGIIIFIGCGILFLFVFS